jgi:hypothetical protein
MRCTRHEYTIADLDIVHRMNAILEVRAHLDLLVVQGELAVDEAAEVSLFTLMQDTAPPQRISDD